MIKKIVILPFLFLSIHFLYIACICNCPKIKDKFFKVDNISVIPYGSNNTIIDTGLAINTTDTFSLHYNFSNACVASHKNPFVGFVNSASACSCEQCGDHGIKSKIRELQITSDSVYNGIPANASLNNVFKIKEWGFYRPSDMITLDTVRSFVNQGYLLFNFSLFSTTKPLDAKGHRFTITLTTEDGVTKTASTKRIFWY